MRLRSLSSRLLLITAVALAPAIAIGVVSLISVQRQRTEDLHSDALRTAELVTREVEQTVTSVESVIRTVAAAPVVRQSDPEDCSQLLADTVAAVSFLAALHVMNADGKIRCSSTSGVLPDPALRGIFDQAIGTDALITGTFVTAGPTLHPQLPIALRIGGQKDAPLGVVIATLDLSWLEQRLQRRSLAQGGAIAIVDRSGTILARIPDPEAFVGTKILDTAMYLLTERQPGTTEVTSRDGTRRVVGYFPPAANAAGVYVSAGFSVSEAYAPMRDLAVQTGTLALLGAALASLVALYTARVFIARPVGVLLDTVTAWRDGDTTARTGMTSERDEIGSAGAALDAFMIELLSNREARAKADEARELMRDELEHREKNLLATVQAIARQTFPQTSNGDAFRVFADRLNAISEANRLLKQSGWQSTPLQSLIETSVATFIGGNHDRVQARGPDLLVKGNVATAIGMSIHELCTNAVKYGALSNDTGRVLIQWAVQPPEEGGSFTLTWTERGGPPVQKPEHTGFGSKVIRHALSAQTGGTVEITHDPQGLVCLLTAPAEAVIALSAA